MKQLTYVVAVLLGFAALVVRAEEQTRWTEQINKIFAIENKKNLCSNGRVDERKLLYELVEKYGLKPAELASNIDKLSLPNGKPIPANAPYEVFMAAWLAQDPVSGLSGGTAEAVKLAQLDLHSVASDPLLQSVTLKGFKVVMEPVLRGTARVNFLNDPWAVNAAVFSNIFGSLGGKQKITFECLPEVSSTDPASSEESSGIPPTAGRGPTSVWSVRAKIDDISLDRSNPLNAAGFKKFSPATVSYTDDREGEKKTTTADIAIGYGYSANARDFFHVFLGYKNSDSDTNDPNDDDTSKDVNALSPGIMWSRILQLGSGTHGTQSSGSSGIYATVGLLPYATFDSAQDSESIRMRAFANDVVFNLPGGTAALCGRELPLLGDFLLAECRLSLFGEVGEVLQAGTNKDYQVLEDDNYVGIGGEAGAIFSFGSKAPKTLRPVLFRVTYRYMGVVSGDLSDPGLLKATAAYKIPKSNFEIGLSLERGQNFETFLDVDTVKLSAGWKY